MKNTSDSNDLLSPTHSPLKQATLTRTGSNRLPRQQRRGAMLVMVAIVLVILLVGAVFSVDIAYMHVVRAELRTATDAAARAGAEALARHQDVDAARQAAIAMAAANRVAGEGLTLTASDIRFGSLQANPNGRFDFVADQTPITAVRVDGRRSQNSADGAVNLFFARMFSTTQFEPQQFATGAANVRDIALVLDISGSMAGAKILALKAAVNDFLDELETSSPNAQVSLATYATTASRRLPLSNQLQTVRDQTNLLVAAGLTAIGDGIMAGSDSLQFDPATRPFAFKSMVVLTDGNHNTGRSPFTAIQTAIDRGQQVHGISFGTGANQTMMRQLAESADGIYIHADDAGDLSNAFRQIARSLSVILVD